MLKISSNATEFVCGISSIRDFSPFETLFLLDELWLLYFASQVLVHGINSVHLELSCYDSKRTNIIIITITTRPPEELHVSFNF